jgi:hypothetical protein
VCWDRQIMRRLGRTLRSVFSSRPKRRSGPSIPVALSWSSEQRRVPRQMLSASTFISRHDVDVVYMGGGTVRAQRRRRRRRRGARAGGDPDGANDTPVNNGCRPGGPQGRFTPPNFVNGLANQLSTTSPGANPDMPVEVGN